MKSFSNERGATKLEYALLASLIAVVCIGSIRAVGRQTYRKANLVGRAMQYKESPLAVQQLVLQDSMVLGPSQARPGPGGGRPRRP